MDTLGEGIERFLLPKKEHKEGKRMRKREDVLHARATGLRKLGKIFMEFGHESSSSPVAAATAAAAAAQASSSTSTSPTSNGGAATRTTMGESPQSTSTGRASVDRGSEASWNAEKDGHRT